MIGEGEGGETQATTLCTSCGLCCTGHLFIWVKLKSSELDSAEASGMRVYRSDPTQRGFSLPCPLWKGKCTIHGSPQYPRACRAYNCKLLKAVLAEEVPISDALAVVEQAKGRIQQLEAHLPASPVISFRERLVAKIEQPTDADLQEDTYVDFKEKAEALLRYFEEKFGVTGFFD